jgi:hypothetical protein
MADHRDHRVSVPDCQRASNSQGRTGQEFRVQDMDARCLVPGGHDHRLIHPHPECTSLHTTYPFFLLHVPARSLNPKQRDRPTEAR